MSNVDHAPFERAKQRPPDDRWFRQEKKERKRKEKQKRLAPALLLTCWTQSEKCEPKRK
jgi:hypothetical protein